MKRMRTKPRKAVLFLRDVPADLKDLFKAWCARRGISMTESIREHMRECVKGDLLSLREIANREEQE